MKRFTETEKWKDAWFFDLPSKWKLAWFYLLDNCDCAGIIEANPRLMSLTIGEPIDGDELLRIMQGRVTRFKPGKWFINKFISFQYGEALNPESNVYKGIYKKLREAGIDATGTLAQPLAKGCPTLQDKDKEQDKDMVLERSAEENQNDIPDLITSQAKPQPQKSPLQLRVEALKGRRPTTPLTATEQKAFQKNSKAIEATTEDDWKALQDFYASPQSETFSRKDLATLVNNWNGEIDRAKAWNTRRTTPQIENNGRYGSKGLAPIR